MTYHHQRRCCCAKKRENRGVRDRCLKLLYLFLLLLLLLINNNNKERTYQQMIFLPLSSTTATTTTSFSSVHVVVNLLTTSVFRYCHAFERSTIRVVRRRRKYQRIHHSSSTLLFLLPYPHRNNHPIQYQYQTQESYQLSATTKTTTTLLSLSGGGGGDTSRTDEPSNNNNSLTNHSSNSNQQWIIHHRIMKQKKIIQKFIDKNFFLVGMVLVLLLARIRPEWGCSITTTTGSMVHNRVKVVEFIVTKISVTMLFLLSGLSIEFQQIRQQLIEKENLKKNVWIQFVIFIMWPLCFGLPLQYLCGGSIRHFFSLPQPILDGIYITTCLPTTINMCVLLTTSASGNVANALCNSIVSNFMGIFMTPLLLYPYFQFFRNTVSSTAIVVGTGNGFIQIPFGDMFYQLGKKVFVPICIGQGLRQISFLRTKYQKSKKLWKRIQDVLLLGIIWNAFCTAMMQQNISLLSIHNTIKLGIIMTILHVTAVGSVFMSLTKTNFLPKFGGEQQDKQQQQLKKQLLKPEDVVAAVYCTTQKTLAFGLPLIQTIFGKSSSLLSYYCAPIMLLHPIQLMIGSILVPYFEQYVSRGNSNTTTTTTTITE